jgi:glycosyltransferase involved in cell wall biosynthesis
MKEHLCYFTPSFSTFVKKDIAILEKEYEVTAFLFAPSKKSFTPFSFIKQKIFILRNILRTSVYVVQFAGYHSFLPSLFARLFGKVCIIIPGGTDCVSFPKINYGNYQKTVLGLFTSWSYRLATMILPVDESLVISENTYAKDQSGPQGILHFNRGLKTPIHVVYNGYSENEWFDLGGRKKGTFISVSAGLNEQTRFILKGFDLIVKLALAQPECHFTFVGSMVLPAGIEIPENIKLVSFANTEELRSLYSENEFYLQLSISEGFPNAICEAMMCGCIPIASNVAALSKIVGKHGYLLNERDSTKLNSIVKTALSEDKNGVDCRKHILEKFNIQRREAELLKFVRLTMNH